MEEPYISKYRRSSDVMATVKTLLLSEVERFGAKYYLVSPMTIKLLFAGHGKADKQVITDKVARLRGKPPEDDNHADAWALAWTVIHYGDQLRMGREEKKIQRHTRGPKTGQAKLF